MNKISQHSRFGTLSVLSASLWSFVILPVLPAYASFQRPQPENTLTSPVDNQAARALAGHIQSASNGADLSIVASNQARSALSGAATAEVERWLSTFGTARVRIGVDSDFTLKDSALDFLLPWYQTPEWVVFSQQSIHRTDDRTQMNLGAGVRHFGSEWMTGANAFYDYDLTRYHSRAGIGAELWRDYLKLGANGYFRLSDWRSAPELNNDYEARPAHGWDIRAEGWLPAYPQVGGKLAVEKYYGKDVALFGRDKRQENPYAFTAGVNWTPVPLVTLSAEHAAGKSGMDDSRFGLQLNWTPGMSMAQHLNPDAVGERRTLAGSRLDLVERNNNIVLEYRKKELIKMALRERAEGLPGQAFTLVTSLQTKHPLQAIDWSAGEFLAAGGQITGSGTATQFILPSYRTGSTAAEAQRLNSYTVSAVARDAQGNVSARAQSVLVVQGTGVPSQGSLEVTVAQDNAFADGIATNQVQVVVKDGAGAVQANTAVNFSVTPGARLSATDVVTDSNGTAQVTLTSATAGSYTVTASAGGVDRTVPVTFAVVPWQGTLTVTPGVFMVGSPGDIVVRLTLQDLNGQPQPGKAVSFSDNLGYLGFTNVTDSGNGTYTANVVIHQTLANFPWDLTLTAWVNGARVTTASLAVISPF
ncbi:inverse autotransporter beta domain-containing protein [Enterobacter sp. Bisph1]|uniref:inverse autotransporter beta domain-containing protein n=1 Tax=Enterobacter sp. Bisph1 TaxID=1274399 RepID=UPI0012E02478|nr:inverse autotransporter beta domain-containing protein [Enterobacter sp. Bisph1]